jgi:hypothetical protein
MKNNCFTVVVGEGRKKNRSFSIMPSRISYPKCIEDIEKRFLERFNTLADTCFFAVPFDEDMWDYIHELRKEILELDSRPDPGNTDTEWNAVQVKTYCESIQERLARCEEALGLKTSDYQVAQTQTVHLGNHVALI